MAKDDGTTVGTPVIGTDALFENERIKVWDFVLEPRPGDHYYCRVDGAETHDARNVGTTRYRNLIIELKEPRGGER